MIYYIRRVLSTGYNIINFIEYLKGSRATRACISNIKSRNNRRENGSLKLKKRRRKEEIIYVPKPKKYRGSNKILCEIDSRTAALPPQICQIWVLGTLVICLIHRSEALTLLYL